MANQGSKGSKGGRSKRTPSNQSYVTNNRLGINRAKRLKKDAKLKAKAANKQPKVARGTTRHERRQMRVLKKACPKHGQQHGPLYGMLRCDLCVGVLKHNVHADKHNGLFARRAKFAQVGATL